MPLSGHCGRVAGTYEIDFVVFNGYALSASVSRTLVVAAKCPEDERLCDNKIDCSGAAGGALAVCKAGYHT